MEPRAMTQASPSERTRLPIDDEVDYRWPHRAGTLSFRTAVDAPEPCPRLESAVAISFFYGAPS